MKTATEAGPPRFLPPPLSDDWKWAEFNCGNVTLALKGGEKLPDVIAGGRVALAVDDVFAAAAELKAQGVRFAIEPTDYSVCHAAAILDPDGNTVILHRRTDGTCGQDLTANPAQETESICRQTPS